MVTLAATLFFSVIACEVVVTPEEEGNMSSSFTEYLLAHAEVVDRYQQEGPCPEVQDEVRFKYFPRFPPIMPLARFESYVTTSSWVRTRGRRETWGQW